MSHICRTCLEEIDDSNCLNLEDDYNEIKMQLTQCIPELDLDLIPNAHLCVYCARVLQASYEFKLRCLNSEEMIREHMKDRILPDLDVIKSDFHPVSDFYNVESLGSGMEVIYIPEDQEIEPVEPFIGYDSTKLPATPDNNENLPEITNNNNDENQGLSPNDLPKVTLTRIKSEERKLYSHVKYNTSKKVEQTYDCPKCDFKTTRSFLLKQHLVTHAATTTPVITTHNSIKMYTCDSCPFKTKKKMRLRAHKISHKNICKVCRFATSSAAALRNHLKEHKETPPPNLKITIKIPNKTMLNGVNNSYKCAKCDYTTVNAKKLKKHQKMHEVDEYKCGKCKYATDNKKYFEQHKPIHMMKPKSNRLQCPECPFADKRSLTLHMNKHSCNGKFKCHLCTYSAFVLETLEKHLRIHK